MFILATTELHKVPATIRSRCQQFAFKRLLPGEIAQRLTDVAQREEIPLTSEGAALLSRLADGGMRDALSLLDQCRVTQGELDENAIIDALGMAGNLETAKMLRQLAVGDTAAALQDLARLYAAGKDIRTMLGELAALCRDLLIRKTAPQGGAALLTGGYDDATMRGLSEQLTAPRLIQMLTVLQETTAALVHSGNQRTDAELCLIRLGDESLDGGALGLSARVARLETMMAYPAAPPAKAPSVPESKPAPAPVPVSDAAPEEKESPRSQAEPPPPLQEETLTADQELPIQAPEQAPPIPVPPVAAGGDTAFWPALLPGLKPLLSPAVWPFLSNPAMTGGVLMGDALILDAKVGVTKSVIDKPEVLEVIAGAAESRLGRPITVTVQAPPPVAGTLDDLLAMGRDLG